MGKTYIIDLPENTHWIQWLMEGTKDHHPYMDFKSVEDLTPYTEPDLERIRKEAYSNGYDDGYSGGRDAGLADAWGAARKIIHMPEGDLLNIFTECYSAVCTALQVLLKYDAAEAIEKLKAYEQKKQESITAEDVMRQYLDTFCKGQSRCGKCPLHTEEFTCGRGLHFLNHNIRKRVSNEEVRRAYAAVLAKMKEES